MISSQKHGRRGKQGVALVVVLGLLAVMVLLGVSFSISMRTERLAASSYLDTVRARHMMDVALAAVLTEHLPESLAGRIYPTWIAFPGNTGGSGSNFLAGAAIRYLPGVLTNEARRADVIDWIDIRDYTAEQTFHGQYSYLIINSSGLLDANIVAGSARARGADPAEIQIALPQQSSSVLLPEVRDGGDLATYRDLWFGRFDTIPELYELGSWSSSTLVTRDNQVAIPPFRRRPSYVDHFHVFSRNPAGSYVSTTGPLRDFPKAYIGGDPDDWDSDEVIIETLRRQPNPIFNSQADAESFLNMLKDYAGEENPANPLDLYIPKEPAGLSFTRVPMINELVFSNNVRLVRGADTNTLELNIHVFVETWFPFAYAPGIASANFEIEMGDVEILAIQARPVHDYSELAATLSLVGDSRRAISPRHSGSDTLSNFRVTEFVFTARMPIDCDGDGPCPQRMELNYTITGPISVMLDNRPVNTVTPNWPNFRQRSEFMAFDPPPSDSLVEPWDPIGVSAFDPRLNWDPQGFLNVPLPGRADTQWDFEAPSLGQINDAAADYRTLPGVDEFGVMYSAQRPLESVAELSYLLYSGDANTPFQPWKTMRLLGPDLDLSARLIDRFTLTKDANRRGLVNINTTHPRVLQAALFNAPIEPWRQASGISRRLSISESEEIAALIVGGVGRSDGIRNLSEIAGLDGLNAGAVSSILNISSADKFLAESALRNSLGVLGARDTLFTVFMRTRVFPAGYDPDPSFSGRINAPSGLEEDDLVAAQQNAVALVWRDPVNEVSRVVSFIWLADFD